MITASRLRIVFLGSDPIALPVLNWLAGEGAADAELVGVFTQPDRPVGRGLHVMPNEIKTWAKERQLPVLQPDKLRDEARQQLAELRPDLSLVMAYGHILRDPFIATPRFGTINLHASLLPKYRGASPIQTAIAQGERETGVSLMRIVRQLDAGPVADQERVCIEQLDTALEVEKKLALACVPLVARNLSKLRSNSIVFQEQHAGEATFCRRLAKTDGVLDFYAPAAQLAARINGLYPWPGCTIAVGDQRVKLGLAASEPADTAAEPGTVLPPDPAAVRVATGSGVLRLLRLQRPGGKMLSAPEFVRGFALAPGQIFPSELMPTLVTMSA